MQIRNFASCLAFSALAGGAFATPEVHISNLANDIAIARDFTNILAKSLSSKAADAAQPVYYIGYSDAAAAKFGNDDLKANEYAVTEKYGAVWMRGEGLNGTRLAVYAYLEDVWGFRHFSPEADGVRYVVHDAVPSAKGLNIRRTNHFPYEHTVLAIYLYGGKETLAWILRNGGTAQYQDWVDRNPVFKGVQTRECIGKDGGHGFFMYMPCKRCYMDRYEWDEKIDFFAQHPEWYSMNAEGKRTDRMQLCFSNPELRKAFTKRVLERCRRVGGEGALTIGAQDVPGAFCLCPECKALTKKYGTNAGPYWDFLPELCAAVAKEYPKIRISTLAYRKGQSEIFPKGIEKFPDNFNCDFAPVDDDQSKWIGGKGNEETLENLKKWCKACSKTTYWYYCCTSEHPFGPVSRVAGDLKRIDAAGVDGVQSCGILSPGVSALNDYVFLRLMIDPNQDPWKRVDEFCDWSYGPIAPEMKALVREYDKLWFKKQPYVGCMDGPERMTIYTPERLARWQRMFAEAEKKIGDDPKVRRNFDWARWDVDFLTLSNWRDVRGRKDLPAGFTLDVLSARLKAAAKKLPRRYSLQRYPQRLENMCLVASALDKPLPKPLCDLPKDVTVHRIPQVGGYIPVANDPDAVCGRAKSEIYPDHHAIFTNNLVNFDYYDDNRRGMIKSGTINIKGYKPGVYQTYLIGKFRLPHGASIHLQWWRINESLECFYPEGDENREFELWASLKFTGPKFGLPTEDGKNRMSCDAFYLVDRGGKIFGK